MKQPTFNLCTAGLIALGSIGLSKAPDEQTEVFTNDGDYTGTDDTFVVNAGPFAGGMSNFGKCPVFEVSKNSRYGLIRFDVSSLFVRYSKIKKLTLRLFSRNTPVGGGVVVYRLSPANSAWREGGNCGGTVIGGGGRHEVTWTHLADYGGFPPRPSWASGTPGPTKAGLDYIDPPLAIRKSTVLAANAKFDIEFQGDLNALIDEWSLATTEPGATDRGGNPRWTPDWNWAQPAPRTTNEGILLMGMDGTKYSFHSSEAAVVALRPKLIVTYVPKEGGPKPEIPEVTEKPSKDRPGYAGTPMLPNGKWRMHDPDRPYPKVVDPGTLLKQEGYPFRPPKEATVLFNGKDLSEWDEIGGRGRWKVENGYFGVFGQHDNCYEALSLLGIPEEKTVKPRIPVRPRILQSKMKFQDFKLHLEWATPREVKGSRLGRANSGLILLGAYEIQILDSYDNPSYADGQAASIYGQYPPEVNACRKPGQWQTFELTFQAPRFHLQEGSVFKNGELKTPARITLIHNGIMVHEKRELFGETTHKTLPNYNRKITFGHILLQDYGSPIRFRNVWIKSL